MKAESKDISKRFVDYSYFKDVAKFQTRLSREEEEKLFQEYSALEKEFRVTLLSMRPVQLKLFDLIKEIQDKNRSIAKLNAKFDNNKAGNNQAIIKKMNAKLLAAKAHSLTSKVAESLYDVGFSKAVYDSLYTNTIIQEEHKERLIKLKERIKEIESKLVCSALMLAVSIAQKYTSNISSMDIKDAIQEATIGVFESVNLYDPSYRTKSGKKIKFSTYANIKAEKRVKTEIMRTSRLIRLPKSRLEVLFIVLKACTGVEELNIEEITRKSNDILEKRKKRKLNSSEVISEERVAEAITLLNNNCIMLDSPIEGWSEVAGEIKTFSDVIPDPQTSIEYEIIKKESKEELVAIIRKYLSPPLSNIIIGRYVNDPPKSHEEISDNLYSFGVTKKPLSKESVRQKENFALQKLLKKDTKEGKLKSLLKESITAREKLGDQ